MRRPRLMAVRPFRPLARVLAPAAAGRARGRFRPLALVFRRSHPRSSVPPAPTLIASDGARVTIAPRLLWRLHLHQHLHRHEHRHAGRHEHLHRGPDRPRNQQVVQPVPPPSPAPARSRSILHRRALGLDVRGRAQALPTIRRTGLAAQTGGGVQRILASAPLPLRHRSGPRSPLPAGIATPGAVAHHQDPNPRGPMRPLPSDWPGAPSPQAARAPAPGRIILARPLVMTSLGSGGQPASTLRPPRTGRAVGERRAAPEAGPVRTSSLTTIDAVAPSHRPLLGLRLPRTGSPGTSSSRGGSGISTVVRALAPDRRDPERPVPPAPITFRRTANAQADRPAPPPARAVSEPPPPVRIDIDRFSDEVIRRIERRSRIERERRGLL